MPAISFWYPSIDLTSSQVYEYRAQRLFDAVPAVHRREFLVLLENVRRTGGVVLGAALETFGATMQDFRLAREAVARAGGTLFIKAELEGERVREWVATEPFQKLLGQLPSKTQLSIRPISHSRHDFIPRSSFVTNEVLGKYHIYLMEEAPPEVLAHEILHAVLDQEGYPSFAGEEGGTWDSALSDVEVEARLLELGLTDPERLDARCRLIARSLEGQTFEWLVVLYVTFSLYSLPRTDARETLRRRVRQVNPVATDTGEALIALIDRGRALRDPESAKTAYTAVADYLFKANIADLRVEFKRDDILV